MDLFGEQLDEVSYDDEPYDEEAEAYVIEHQAATLVHPRGMSFCLGHEAPEKLFLDLFQRNSLPHAMIFSGPEGIGKATMAFRLARFLFKHGKPHEAGLFGDEPLPVFETLDVAANDPVFSRVASGGHPDLLYIDREVDSKEKKDSGVKVEAVRKIAPFLYKTASEGGWRIVIVEDADTMNRNAQNALLKIFEEPPARVLIILIAHRPGLLVPTIHSRARKVFFSPLSAVALEDLLARQGHHLSPRDLEVVSVLSGGSIGRALHYVEQGGLEMLGTINGFLEQYPAWRWPEIHALSAKLTTGTREDSYDLFAELFQWVFRQVLFAKAHGRSDLPPYLQRPALTDFLRHSSLERLIRICDDLKNHFETAEFANLDKREAVRAAFTMINERK